ncbi:hypothetical protein BD410DRAFT_810536, partial [Rickenella mellea]
MAGTPDYGPSPYSAIHPDLMTEDMDRMRAADPNWVKPVSFERVAFVKATQGWARDGDGGPIAQAKGFHDGFQKTSEARRLTRKLGHEVIRDTIVAMDRTCAVGSITFHVN